MDEWEELFGTNESAYLIVKSIPGAETDQVSVELLYRVFRARLMEELEEQVVRGMAEFIRDSTSEPKFEHVEYGVELGNKDC